MPKTIKDLFLAIHSNDLEGVKICLDDGVDIEGMYSEMSEKHGAGYKHYDHQPLYWAAYYGVIEIVRYLVTRDAKITSAVLSVAKENHHGHVETFLGTIERLRNTPEWSLLGPSVAVHTVASVAIDRKLTEVFNFESRRYHTIEESLNSPERQHYTPETGFEDLPQGMLEKALREFKKLGGEADEDFVLRGKSTIHKDLPHRLNPLGG